MPGADIWLPGEEFHGEEFDMERASSDLELAEEFRARLKLIDHRLDLIWVKDGARSFPRGARWYIVRDNPGGLPATYWMVNDGTEEEGYDTPAERHLERLRAMDTARHPDAWRSYEKNRLKHDQAKEKRRAVRREERREQTADILSHHLDVRVSVPEMPWVV
jgi:hypothetical protein